MAEQDGPTLGPNEFTAEQERQMRQARVANRLMDFAPAPLPVVSGVRALFGQNSQSNGEK
jgi:hypothetical protein